MAEQRAKSAAEDRRVDPTAWWRRRRDDLLAIAQDGTPVYVYDTEVLEEAVDELRQVDTVEQIFYSIKANPHPEIVRRFHEAGLGFECVSFDEVEHLFEHVPNLEPHLILFTPNFAPRGEYASAFDRDVQVTVDNLYPLEKWADLFRGREIFLRLDPGFGRGHHDHVKTAGTNSKFGVFHDQLEALSSLVCRAGARVTGLHAHTGSGILSAHNWAENARYLAEVAEHRFPDVTVLDLGGGLGVVERPGQTALDIDAVDASLRQFRAVYPRFELWLEPGRFLVARAGVLLARVTQIKHKGERTFVGIDAGMNSLIRPALYGAWHPIVNLSRLSDEPTQVADVVGPICETGDVLGYERPIAPAHEGDVLLIGSVGAYGHAMSSSYNLRSPAREVII